MAKGSPGGALYTMEYGYQFTFQVTTSEAKDSRPKPSAGFADHDLTASL